MTTTIILAAVKYGAPYVGALFAWLAHRKARQIHAIISAKTPPAPASK